jgi:hypothetical protein
MATPWLDIRDLPFATLQDAIDLLLNDGVPGCKTLYLPRGQFKLTAPLRIARVQGGKYVPCTLEIVGEATALTEGIAAPESRVGTVLSAEFADGPAIYIQSAAQVRLRRLNLVGQNNWIQHDAGSAPKFDPHDLATHMREELEDPPLTPDPYVLDGVRGSPSSPHAGICIDPFHPSVKAGAPGEEAKGDRYPPIAGAYAWEGPASAHVLIEDCVISDFVVGVCVAPSGLPLLSQGTPTVTLTNCYLSQSKSCVSVSGDYQVLLRSIQFGTSRHCIDCVGFGGESKRPGRCPSVEGGNIGGVKYVFRTGNTGTSASFHGIYAENTLSLGQLGTPQRSAAEPLDVYTFHGCAWSFITPQDVDAQFKYDPIKARPSLPAMNAHLFNFAHTTFRGCQFLPNWAGKATEIAGPPLHIVNQGQLALQGCFLGAGHNETILDLGPQFWISGRPEAVWYDNCVMQDVHYIDGKRAHYKLRLSSIKAVPTFHKTEYLQSPAIPGSLYYFQDYRTSKEEEQYKDTFNGMLQPYQPEKRGLRYVAGHWPLIPLGTPVKIDLGKTGIINKHGKPVDWPNGKATFAVESGLVLVGDILVARRVMLNRNAWILDHPRNRAT